MAPPTDAEKQRQQSADETIPRRHVSGQTLVSSHLPAVEIDVAPAFTYVDRFQFILYDAAHVESFVFAAAGAGQAGRLLVLQFEGYLESNDFTYADA